MAEEFGIKVKVLRFTAFFNAWVSRVRFSTVWKNSTVSAKPRKNVGFLVFVFWLVAAAQREEAQGQPSGNTGAA